MSLVPGNEDAFVPGLNPAHAPPMGARRNYKHEMLLVIWLVVAFTSSTPLVVSDLTVEHPVMINFMVSGPCLHFLAEALGEQYVALVAILSAMIMALIDIYAGRNVAIFIVCLSVTIVGACAFSLVALRRLWLMEQSSSSSKLFVATNLILKSLVENGVIPVTTIDGTSTTHDLQTAFSLLSFFFIVMALWLNAAGVGILNPFRAASYSLAQSNPSSIVASILYWTGAALVIASIITTVAIAATGTPIIVKLASAVFGICAVAVVFKLPEEVGNN